MSMSTMDRLDGVAARAGGAGPWDASAIDPLVELVRTPSVSGAERGAVECFVRWARALGFETAIDDVGNGLAWRSTVASRSARPVQLMLLGHIDTVPGEIPVRIEDGVLHGRGSVDAKGPLAAMLVAAARADLPPDTTVIVAAAVGEETPRSVGARHLAARFLPDACIVGEPSGADGVTLGYKGRLVAHAVTTAECAHTAGPAGSSSDRLFAWWSRVVALAAARNEGVAIEFDRLQCSIRSAASHNDGLADSAQLTAGFRLPPALDPHDLADRLRALADGAITLAFEGHETAHRTTRNDAVVRALSTAIRAGGATPRPKLKTGTADLNVVAPVWRCPIAAYGPGDSALDHTPHERISLDEYLTSIRVLTHAIPTLAAELSAERSGPANTTPLSLTP
ncbi:MAG TPA: [LysW]-lysine hydrolase [Phycisphaerales bacterium]|nr:[LysW]-lysine hydrolase [Phycisphaerales bacterium]